MKYHVQIGETRYEVEIEDLNARPVRARVNGQVFEVTPAAETAPPPGTPAPQPEPTARSRPAASAAPLPPRGGKTLTAPLPGVLTEINVKAGDSLSPGQPICVIEAMKMKNILRATAAGRVKQVLASAGQSVSHRQALVEFE